MLSGSVVKVLQMKMKDAIKGLDGAVRARRESDSARRYSLSACRACRWEICELAILINACELGGCCGVIVGHRVRERCEQARDDLGDAEHVRVQSHFWGLRAGQRRMQALRAVVHKECLQENAPAIEGDMRRPCDGDKIERSARKWAFCCQADLRQAAEIGVSRRGPQAQLSAPGNGKGAERCTHTPYCRMAKHTCHASGYAATAHIPTEPRGDRGNIEEKKQKNETHGVATKNWLG
ncbi:hypothetical protein DENSPDRAFT_855004 [Dentipellis sp. KUC8613]|nr:hypothetical protein DENSPDRAFT_855004 [Dentipellis sp. KUC8613]